jgi:hypothetical protein
MVVETFKPESVGYIYTRLKLTGRMLPEGLIYINSWVNREKGICFQVMQTKDATLFKQWTEVWKDHIDFEIIKIDNVPS